MNGSRNHLREGRASNVLQWVIVIACLGAAIARGVWPRAADRETAAFLALAAVVLVIPRVAELTVGGVKVKMFKELKQRVESLSTELKFILEAQERIEKYDHLRNQNPAAPPLDVPAQMIKTLRQLTRKDPTSRQLGVIGGKLYRRAAQIEQAIKFVTAVIDVRGQRKDDMKDRDWQMDDAWLHYNRACYRSLLAESLTGNEREQALTEAREDFEQSLQWDEAYKGRAAKDDDLKALHERYRDRFP